MSIILVNLRKTVLSGLVLSGVLIVVYIASGGSVFDYWFIIFMIRWLHVLSGVMWIGLLWYFSLVQDPNVPDIPEDQKPAISKVIKPAALWWFRWGAMTTIVTGLILAMLNGYLIEAILLGLTDGVAKHTAIGIGMWLGTIMWFNVWFVIWPSEKRSLGNVDSSSSEMMASNDTAVRASRINSILSFPMLFAMVSAQNLY